MSELYKYSEYNSVNRFINIDGLEAKIIEHLMNSSTKYAENFWRILKYDSKDALSCSALTKEEKIKLVDGYGGNSSGGQTEDTRVFFSPFVDDAWVKECSSVYIFVDDIYPLGVTKANVSLTVETVIHAKINAIYGDADFISNPGGTNPNDYYFSNAEAPVVQYKSRATVLLKCILAELNGLYLDGIGYLLFNTQGDSSSGDVKGKAKLSLFNRRSFFGHSVQFNVAMSGVSDDADNGF